MLPPKKGLMKSTTSPTTSNTSTTDLNNAFAKTQEMLNVNSMISQKEIKECLNDGSDD